jgi:phospholipase/carboxylesterase
MDAITYQLREPAGDPDSMLVLFHGRGADEHDLFGLLDALDPGRRLIGVTPRGPRSYFPPGGAHWYRLHRVGYPDPDSFEDTYSSLDRWLSELAVDTGVGIEHTILGGFSQGSVMAYSMAFGAGRPAPAGVVAFSGFLPEVPGFDLDLTDRSGFPVAIGHGLADQVIPVAFGRSARDRLEHAGADVTYRESPMPHAIDPDFVVSLRPWIEARTP